MIKWLGQSRVKVNPPAKQTQPVADVEPEKSHSAVWAVSIAVSVFILALSAFYLKKSLLLADYEQKIASNNVSILLQVTHDLSTENKDTIERLKQPLIGVIDAMVFDLNKSPEKVTNLKTLKEIIENLATIYSDSSSVQVLSAELARYDEQMQRDFREISRRFARARTAIANIKLDTNDSETDLAYQYSNSLFPLLGRIEYAEKTNDPEELDRSLSLINVYLHKIAQLKATQTQHHSIKLWLNNHVKKYNTSSYISIHCTRYSVYWWTLSSTLLGTDTVTKTIWFIGIGVIALIFLAYQAILFVRKSQNKDQQLETEEEALSLVIRASA